MAEGRTIWIDQPGSPRSQFRRSHIAEGAGNTSNKEFCRFLQYSLRSGYEVMTAIDIARGLEFISNERADSDEIAAMTVGLMKSLGWRSTSRPKTSDD